MANVTSNLGSIQAALKAIGETFAFDRPGREQSLGRDALSTIVVAIEDRCKAEEAPGGSGWAPNKDWATKDKRKLGKPIGVLGDQDNMLAPVQLAGEQTITRESAVAVYGIDDNAKQKAEWFTEGGPDRAPRPFYEMDGATDAALEAFLDEEIDRYLGSF